MSKGSISLAGISLGVSFLYACGSNDRSLSVEPPADGGQKSEGGTEVSSAAGASEGLGSFPGGSSTDDGAADVAQPGLPCSVDSDCGNPFLSCVAQLVTMCRATNSVNADAAMTSRGSIPVDLPTCPTQAQVTVNLCSVRYLLPCQVDSDCGPDGFTCADGQCSSQAFVNCSEDSECPQGWSCHDPCCGGSAPNCYPPFAVTSCGVCRT
jgi:hypothetical protein